MGGAGCQAKQGGADCTTEYDTVVHLILISCNGLRCELGNVIRVVSHSKPQKGLHFYDYLADIKQLQDTKPQS